MIISITMTTFVFPLNTYLLSDDLRWIAHGDGHGSTCGVPNAIVSSADIGALYMAVHTLQGHAQSLPSNTD